MTRTANTHTHRTQIGRQAGTRWWHPPTDETWKTWAACRGENPELFFPKDDGDRRRHRQVRALTNQARIICAQCPVAEDCLAYAIAIDARYGIWGGLTDTERTAITGKKAYW